MKLSIIRSLKIHESLHGWSVKDIAAEIGAFHSDIEEILKELQDDGTVVAYIYEGELYFVLEDQDALRKIQEKWVEKEKEETETESEPVEEVKEEPLEKKQKPSRDPQMYQ